MMVILIVSIFPHYERWKTKCIYTAFLAILFHIIYREPRSSWGSREGQGIMLPPQTHDRLKKNCESTVAVVVSRDSVSTLTVAKCVAYSAFLCGNWGACNWAAVSMSECQTAGQAYWRCGLGLLVHTGDYRAYRRFRWLCGLWTRLYNAEANTQMGRRMHQNTHFETLKWKTFLGLSPAQTIPHWWGGYSRGLRRLYSCAFGARLAP